MGISKAQLKYVRSLKLKKFRQKYNKFLVEGDKIIRDLLLTQPTRIEELFALESWLLQYGPVLDEFTGVVVVVSEKELAQLSAFSTPNQVLAVGTPPDFFPLAHFQTGFSLYLDGLQDPGNVGTILRIADWFGLRGVLFSPDTVDPWNPKVLQASMGSVFAVPLAQVDLLESSELSGLPAYGTYMEGTSIYGTVLPKDGLLIIGNEGQGIRSRLSVRINERIAIPAAGQPQVDSLNAAMATGIIAAFYRQQHVE